MLGPSHALSGAVTGIAAGIFLHLPVPQTAALAGCMPGFPVVKHRFHLLPEPLAFTTGTRPELLIVDPILTGSLLVLTALAADPAFVTAQWHSLAG
jgi:hypothetical protein